MSKIQTALDFAFSHGLVLYQNDGQINHAPFSLKPAPFPQKNIKQAYDLASDFNQLLVNIAHDPDFLSQTFQPMADDFSQKLLAIYQQIYLKQSPVQTVAFNLFRADYLLQPSGSTHQLRQVEINTIAAAFVSLSSKISDLHRYLYPRRNLPPNDNLTQVSDGLALAWQAYERSNTWVLFVVQKPERNRFDQQQMAHALFFHHGIRSMRLTLAQVHHQCRLKKQRLYIGQREIALVYFRAGYSPNDYPSKQHWAARLLLERSAAIKVPTVAFQLAGMKQVQQSVADVDALKKFIPDSAQRQRMQACFAQFYPLHDETHRQLACTQPDDLVLKPQREGGGNNVYGHDLAKKIKKMDKADYTSWVLMEKIHAPVHQGRLVQQQKITAKQPLISELGIFATCLSQGQQLYHSQATGHLLRTKLAYHHEGGIVAGFAALDSPNAVKTL